MAPRTIPRSLLVASAQESDSGRWMVGAAACFGVALLYAITRYHVLGAVPWSFLPLFTANKAVSFTAAMLLAAAYLAGSKRLALRFGLLGFALALLHSLFSLALLGPADYPALYRAGRLNLAGQFSVLFGCLCVAAFAVPAAASVPSVGESLGRRRWKRCQRLGYAGLLLVALHVFAIGFRGWLAPASWPGGLPPITGLSFLAALAPLAWRTRR